MSFRILFYYGSLNFDTGSPRSLTAQIDLLDRFMFTPIFLANGQGPLVQELKQRGVSILPGKVNGVSWRRPFLGYQSIRRQMELLKTNSIDLLHVNEEGWNFDLVIAAWLLKIPVVLQIHNPGRVGFQNLHRFAASKILFVSNTQRDQYEMLKRFHAPVQVIYSPVASDYYLSGKSIRSSLGFKPDDIVICTIAQLTHRKGIDLILDAADSLCQNFSNLHFIIIGPLGSGHEEFGKAMMARVEQGPLADKVHFLGSRNDVPDLLASSDLFLFPTRNETFGRGIVEAMAAKIPVVASRIPVMEEVISTSDFGVLVSPLTGEAFAKAISEVLNLPDKGRSMGLKGYERFINAFSHDIIKKQFNQMYADLVKQSKATETPAAKFDS